MVHKRSSTLRVTNKSKAQVKVPKAEVAGKKKIPIENGP